ncbi:MULTISPECIES: triacylglycerol lipase [unclassified Pseudomonas]|uniref:esterase/lipase family protein n=1 Tax=unclassified Pseudomonas TaxID=196821 RepID=UPI0008718D03|nr:MULTISPECIES: triacylglycerol lipase [unclassified Pseudomonas]SCW30832.1 alpha/beta hydrolase fold [Pseudomonas sp. NFACC05-1]SCZ31467.1 alpha/beta hydrolase fold [Pseudomonas sp. NFACC44-2]SDA42793.1 alpha/beta hydrolase fold [Pseudomonas sp. NFACC51]SEI54790.1 alpha/beta hydrolase fold [Pseudomonas sp. NFACC07-1]SFH55136.1 alpha/beta hydrolase fold [Pseudomonas sp. NFACC54]
MQRNATTQFPILLVHGLFGFDRIGGFELFHGIKQALRLAGARVFIPYLSATHSNEARGEQLLAQMDLILSGTDTTKVNLIGHSQGALAARYAAALAPGRVASVTSVSGPNHGSELADFLHKALTPGRLPGPVASKVATLFADFISLLDGQPQLPPAAVAALAALTTEGVGAFNDKYPQGLPRHWGESGPNKVNGVRYYSWSGTLPDAQEEGRPAMDPVHAFCRAFSEYFITEAGQNDGMVGRFSSHLGKVIRSNYPLHHMSTLNPATDPVRRGTDPTELYLRHAERLRKAGL